MNTLTPADNPFLQLPQRFDPSNYHGAEAWANLAVQSISSTPSRSMELIGLPGMGKSYLLRYLADPEGALLRNTNVLQPPFRENPSNIFPLFVEFKLLPSGTHPFVYMFKRFRDEFVKSRAFSDLPLFDSIKTVEPNSPGQATAILEDILLKLNGNGVRTAFLFDDFHLAFKLLSLEETTRLRPWREAASFILTTERRLDKVNSEAAGSPFFQTLQVIPFGGLPIAAARNLVSEPADEAGWPFHEDDIEFAINRADGHPLLLILAGRAIWDSRNSLSPTPSQEISVSGEYPAMLIGRMKEWFFPVFKMYWEHLDPEEQHALRSSVGLEPSAPSHDRALAFLQQLGIVKFDPNRGKYKPFSPLLSEYLKENQIRMQRQKAGRNAGIESNLFNYLHRNMNRPTSFVELSREVWGERIRNEEIDEVLKRRIQVAVSRLRKKLQESGKGDVVSIRAEGYQLVLS
jgi:hypothetical protein